MRLLVVGSSRSALSIDLVRGVLEAARAHSEVDVIAVCDTAPEGPPGKGAVAGEALAAVVKRATGAPSSLRRSVLLGRGLPGVVIRPPWGDPNETRFVELVEALRPDASIWLGSVRIARAPLLRALSRSVNYHNGALPGIRGTHATAWSVYREERTTGFSFHVMDEGIDTGPVVVAGELPVPSGATTVELEAAKTAAAIAALPRVLAAIVAGDGGRLQDRESASFGQREYHDVTVVADPSAITWRDLALRLRAFGRVWVNLPAGMLEVTRVRRCEGRGRHASVRFVTADGVTAEAIRFRFLPLPLYRAARRAERVRPARRSRSGSG